jgi:glutamyl-tRNA synthetase
MAQPPNADGRFAPSPTGPLHLGNLRTALAAWLFARSQGAAFRMRIEDLDPDRSRPEHEAGQLADLRAIGLDWDGQPVRQSSRHERHREAFEQLRARDLVYPCWCTRADLREAAQAPNGALPDAYPGTCAQLDDAARAQRADRPASWRLRASAAGITFDDAVHGPQSGTVDDFIVWRADDTPAYNLAVVVDDADSAVGQVVRGDDLLSSTPRQLLLARVLDLRAPSYAHVPLVLGPDGRRLAKRHGAVTLTQRLERGETVEQLVGWMAASLGLAAAGRCAHPRGLVKSFDPSHIVHEPTVLVDVP